MTTIMRDINVLRSNVTIIRSALISSRLLCESQSPELELIFSDLLTRLENDVRPLVDARYETEMRTYLSKMTRGFYETDLDKEGTKKEFLERLQHRQ